MLRPFPVNLAAPNPASPAIAAAQIAALSALGPLLCTIHHIGSTAVPGLIAKLILDLMPVAACPDAVDDAAPDFAALGYTAQGEYGIPGRRYFVMADADGTRLVQLHVFPVGSPHIERRLTFRDWLRAHPDERQAYAAEKQRARDRSPGDSHAYTDAKAPWIRAAEARALVWFRSAR